MFVHVRERKKGKKGRKREFEQEANTRKLKSIYRYA